MWNRFLLVSARCNDALPAFPEFAGECISRMSLCCWIANIIVHVVSWIAPSILCLVHTHTHTHTHTHRHQRKPNTLHTFDVYIMSIAISMMKVCSPNIHFSAEYEREQTKYSN